MFSGIQTDDRSCRQASCHFGETGIEEGGECPRIELGRSRSVELVDGMGLKTFGPVCPRKFDGMFQQ